MTVRAGVRADIDAIVRLYNTSLLAQVLGLTRADGAEMLDVLQQHHGRIVVNDQAGTIIAFVSGWLDDSSMDPQIYFQFLDAGNGGTLASIRPCLRAAAQFALANIPGVTRAYTSVPQDPRLATVRSYAEAQFPYLHDDPALPGYDGGADFRVMGALLTDIVARG